MQSPGREPSMEDILASIKKVIAEEKELRTAASADAARGRAAARGRRSGRGARSTCSSWTSRWRRRSTLGRRCSTRDVAGHSREALEQLSTIAATVPPPPQVNPLEDMVREMLKPILKQWLDEHLPQMVDEHVKREISRITGDHSAAG